MRSWLLWSAALAVVALCMWWLVRGDDHATGVPDTPDGAVRDTQPGTTLKGRGSEQTPEVPAPEGAVTDGFPLSGRVLDAGGAPVAGVLVAICLDPPRRGYGDGGRSHFEWHWRRAEREAEIYARTKSDEEGRFRFRSLPDGRGARVVARPSPPLVGTTASVRISGHPTSEVVLVLGQGAGLHGRVLDMDDQGLRADLAIRMKTGALAEHWPNGFHRRGIRTEEDGSFHVDALPAGTAGIEVHVPGRIRRTILVSLPHEGSLELRPFAAHSVTIEGTVRDAAGACISGVRLVAEIQGDESCTGMAATLADGTYRMAGLPPGALRRVQALAEGYIIGTYEGGRRALDAGATLRIDLTLIRGAVLVGHVRDDEGQPLAHARVHASAHVPGTILHWVSETDATGAYRLEGLPPKCSASVLVRASGFFQPEQDGGVLVKAEPALVRAVLAADEETTSLDLLVLPCAPVEGVTVDADGQPVAGAHVKAEPARGTRYALVVQFDMQRPEVRSDVAGRFVLDELPPGTSWDVVARTESLRSETTRVDLLEAQAGPLQLILAPSASIGGRVLGSTGAPLDRGRVSAVVAGRRQLVASVGPDGRFRFHGIESGSYVLQALSVTSQRIADPLALQVAAGEQIEDVILRTRSASEIGGVLVDMSGAPLPETSVAVYRLGGRLPFTRVRTDAEGRFHLEVWEEGDLRFRVGQDFVGDTWPIGRTDLRLMLDRAGVRATEITIRIVDPDGEPVPNCKLQVWTGKGGSSSGTTRDVDGGTYVLRTSQLSEQTTLSVSTPRAADGTPLNLQGATYPDIDTSQPTLEIRLEEGRVVRGMVADTAGGPVADVWISVARRDFLLRVPGTQTDTEGRFALAGLAPGALELRVTTEAPWLPVPRVSISDGQEEVQITVVEGATFVGRVLGPDGAAVAGVQVRVRGTWEGPGWHRDTKTDAEGRFDLGGIPRSSVMQISIETRRSSVALPSKRLEEVPYGSGSIEIRLGDAVWIEGSVVDASGAPLLTGSVGASTIVFVRPAARVSLDGSTNRFRLGPLTRGRYRVSVHAGVGYAESPSVEADAPSTGLVLVALREVQPTGRLLVDDARGWGVLWAHPGGSRYANLESDGRFVVHGAADIVATLYATGPNGQYAELPQVRASDGPFELEPRSGGRITGKVEGYVKRARGGPRVHAYRDGIALGARIEEDGRFEIGSVGPGAWAVHLVDDKGFVQTVAGVVAGAENVALAYDGGKPR